MLEMSNYKMLLTTFKKSVSPASQNYIIVYEEL